MPPVLRKRSAPPPPPVEEETSSEDEHSVVDEPDTSPTSNRKYICPAKGCETRCKLVGDLRVHYRTHSKKRPYECTFPSCELAFADLSNLYKHILKVHHQHSKKTAKEFVRVRKEVLVEETKVLGLKEYFTGKTDGEEMSEDDDSDATVTNPTLPPFTTIHRTSTGHLICPFSECDQQARKMVDLKSHYRVHCAGEYRPYRCTFSGSSCGYSSIRRGDVERHIRVRHFHEPRSIKRRNEAAKDRNESDFIETRTDLLQMEDALFSRAQVVSSPEEVSLPFACSFEDCEQKFSSTDHLSRHLQFHSKCRPFKCSFLDCSHTATRKQHLLRHILTAHFDVSRKDCQNLSSEEKLKAEQYVEVDEDLLEEERAKRPSKNGHKGQKLHTANTVPENFSFDFCEVQLDETFANELSSFLATVQPN